MCLYVVNDSFDFELHSFQAKTRLSSFVHFVVSVVETCHVVYSVPDPLGSIFLPQHFPQGLATQTLRRKEKSQENRSLLLLRSTEYQRKIDGGFLINTHFPVAQSILYTACLKLK